MEEKLCNGCQKSKPLTDDNFGRRGNGWQARCKMCQGEYHKQHYIDNMDAYKDRAKQRNKEITDRVRQYIQEQKDKPCQDCGVKYPYYVMDFDHRPGSGKSFNIAQMARIKPTLEKVQQEIAKCDIVCSNCHRIRTHNRR